MHPDETVARTPAIQNCYATGYFEAEKQKVGGIAGYTETTIKDCVSYADLRVKDGTTNFIGLITGLCSNGPEGILSGGTKTYGFIDNCYAYEDAVMTKGEDVIAPTNFNTPAVDEVSPVDGTLKDLAYLTDPTNYSTDLNFPLSGEGAAWSETLRGKNLQLA